MPPPGPSTGTIRRAGKEGGGVAFAHSSCGSRSHRGEASSAAAAEEACGGRIHTDGHVSAAVRRRKLVVLMVSLVLAIFGVTVFFSSFTIQDHHMQKLFVGCMGIVTSMSMYSPPLVAMKQVIRTRSVEFMPFYLSLFSFLTSSIWMLYGILGRDPYLTSPNCIGCVTGILQLVFYCIYSRREEDEESPKTLNDAEQANNKELMMTTGKDANGYKP